MRIIRPFCKTVLYAFLQILAGFAIDCKAFINGQRQPRAEKICLYAVRGGVCSRYGKVNFLYSII